MLIDEAKVLVEDLKKLATSKIDSDEVSSLQEKRICLESWLGEINKLKGVHTLFGKQEILKSANQNVKGLTSLLNKILNEFRVDRNHETLTKENRWTDLDKKYSTFKDSLKSSLEGDWNTYFESKYSRPTPSVQQQTIAMNLPKNVDELQEYKKIFIELNEYKKSLPASEEIFDECDELLRKLDLISGRFVNAEKLPDFVVSFFLALKNSGMGGVPLCDVTPEVIDWLRSNNLLNNYVVRSK